MQPSACSVYASRGEKMVRGEGMEWSDEDKERERKDKCVCSVQLCESLRWKDKVGGKS